VHRQIRLRNPRRLFIVVWLHWVAACGASASNGPVGAAGSNQGAQGGSLNAGNGVSAGASEAVGGSGNAVGSGNGGASGGSAGGARTGGGSGSAGTAAMAGSGGSGTPGAGGSSASPDSAGSSGASGQGGSSGAQDSLSSNRQRLWQSYYDFLLASATRPQSNGLSSSNVSSACDAWSKLDPSSQAVFLTLTARLQGSIIGADGTSMLAHIVKVYRVTGGQLATATDPGSCGGGEYNLMLLSMDTELHHAQVAANAHQGGPQPNGKYDLADAPLGTFWRDSHDAGGAHAPFDSSDETDTGAPRGQTQYFLDPMSATANAALGRTDLTTLVDPYALEIGQDYDCVHDSNPLCSYTSYGAQCLPQAPTLGTDLCAQNYGSIDSEWTPLCN